MKTPIIKSFSVAKRLLRHSHPKLCAIILGMAAASQLAAQNFGVHFLGNTSPADNVTGSAGVVPITNWNNINNVNFTPGNSTTITSSDGSATATLNLSGSQVTKGWNSGLTGDGANFSLLHGYIDAGAYGSTSPIATVSGLTNGEAFDVYVYSFADNCHPGSAADKLPNYAVNGITHYVPELGVGASGYTSTGVVGNQGFTGFMPGTISSTNVAQEIPAASFGNYIAISNVSSGVGGQITIIPEADKTTYRSSLDGIEIVPSSGPSFGIHFLGNATSDPVTSTAGVVPIGDWNNIDNGGYASGSATSITGSDGLTSATLTLTGSEINNAWNSGLAGDGANMSLMHGFMDAGNYNDSTGANIVISGLPANTSYTVYVYCMSDSSKPGGAGSLLPNYSVNGTTYYVPILGATGSSTFITTGSVGGYGFAGFVQGTPTNANSSLPAIPADFGNYIAITNVSSGAGGQITVEPEKDLSTYRSPLNGFELVPNSGPSFGVHFLGNASSDPVTSTAGVVPIGVWNNVADAASSHTITGSDGSTAATLAISSGGQAGNAWSSTGANSSHGGGNLSLMNGFWDAGNYNGSAATATVSGLPPNTTYTVYVYCLSDGTKPGSGQLLPNYTVNGTTYYVPVLGYQTATTFITTANVGGPFTGFVQGTPSSVNSAQPAIYANFGNYVRYHNIPAVGGQIIIEPEADATTYRSAFNGFELVGLGAPAVPVISLPLYNPNVSPIYAGTMVTFTETAAGVPTLAYHWLADNGTGILSPVNGANSSNLVVDTTGFAPTNYEYEVIVTNSSGASTSAVVTISVVAGSAPILVTDITPTPANEAYVGETVTYSPTFTGTLPISYQWMVDTGSGPTNIPSSVNASAITSTLVLNALQIANSGTYTLNANNSVGGPVSSSSSALTVLPVPPAPPSGTYGTWILSNNPVAYWPLNDTNDPSTGVAPVYDASGHELDGVYGQYSQNGFDGVAGPQPPGFPGFTANDWAMASVEDLTNSWATVPPINLDTNTATITMWIYPTTIESFHAGLFCNRPYGAGLGFGGAENGSGMYELGYTWNNNNGNTWGWDSQLYPLQNQWSFVALVVQPTQATIYLYYIDPNTGQPDLYSAVNTVSHQAAPFGSGNTTTIGSDFDSTNDVLTRTFSGSIAHVAVFNTALNSGRILQLFNEGAGLAPIAPTIAGQPQSLALLAGSTATFTASGIVGSTPITNQWQFNGTNINGATNASLTISDITPANAGSYQLFVSNPAGTNGSSVATLTVVPVVSNSYDAAVLANGPLVYYKLDESTTNPTDGGVVAYDYVNGYNGVYQVGAEDGFNGILGPEAPAFPGFATTNGALGTFVDVPTSYVTASVGNLVATNLTYVLWINPSGPVENFAGLLFDRGGAGEGFCFGPDTNSSGMADLGYTWNQNNADTFNYGTYLFPPANQWSLVAMTIAPSGAEFYLINSSGIQTAANPITHDSERFGVAWHIGDDASDGATGNRTFPGSIADVSVYLSTLSSNQIVSLYDAGAPLAPSVTLNITPTPVGKLTLTWSQGTLLQATTLTGPWTTNSAAVSPYSITPTNTQMFFRVRVQ